MKDLTMETMRRVFPSLYRDFHNELNNCLPHVQGAYFPFHHEQAISFLLKTAIEKEIPVDYFIDDSKWGFYNFNSYPLFEQLVKKGIETRVVFPYEPPREEAFDLGGLEREFTNLKVRVVGLSREKEIMNFMIVGDRHLWRTTGHESFKGYHISLLYPEVWASVYINQEDDKESSEKLRRIFEKAFEFGSLLY